MGCKILNSGLWIQDSEVPIRWESSNGELNNESVKASAFRSVHLLMIFFLLFTPTRFDELVDSQNLSRTEFRCREGVPVQELANAILLDDG